MSLIYNATFDSQTRVLSLLDKAGNVISSCEVPSKELVDDVTKPLTFKATQDGSKVTLYKYGSPSGAFQTSRDGGNTWTDYKIGTAISLNTGNEVSFRAEYDRTSYLDGSVYFYFSMKGKIEAWHNVMSLYRTNDFATYNTTPGTNTFINLFKGCTSLTKAPALPATTLDSNCYDSMFEGCTSLTEAPALPATTLANNCYWSMFEGCTSLTEAPALPATTLASGCYYYMFKGCTSLTKAPALPATTLDSNCYREMFEGCTSLAEAPELPATTLAVACYYCMFKGCTSLTKAPELPATALASSCYYYMFNGCSSLNEVRCNIPSSYTSSQISSYASNWLEGVSSTGTFYTNADANWPSGASGIPEGWNRVPEIAPSVDDITKPLTFRATQDGSTVKLRKNGSPYSSFQTSRDGGNTWTDYTIDTAIALNTGEEVSFRAKADRSAQSEGDYIYFEMTGKIEAWHNVMSMIFTNDFPTYKATVSYAFNRMFGSCTSLTKAPVLPAISLSKYCYLYMFYGCTSLTEAPELPATTLAQNCYTYMFSNCTSLTKTPELPATTLADYCYTHMFSGCSSLNEVRCKMSSSYRSIDIPKYTGSSGDAWLYGVSSTGTFYTNANANWPSGESGIPKNWTRLNINDYPTNP